MFEQSMLLDSAAGKKAGALAASLTLQTAGLGTLLLLPLIYTGRLPLVQVYSPLVPRITPDPPAPHTPAPAPSARASSVPRVFSAPTRIPPLSTQPSIADDLPAADAAIGLTVPLPAIAPLGVLPRIEAAPPAVHSVPAAATPKRIVRVGSAQEAKLIHKVLPIYPPLAKLTHVSGTVHLTGIISTDGTIQDLHVENGPPLLIRAALEAVRQWIYQPTLLNGEPVEVATSIDVTFTLTQ
jgi:protein TonB